MGQLYPTNFIEISVIGWLVGWLDCASELSGHDACARLRVFAVARGTKASQRIYDVYVGNAGSEHYPRGWARRRAVMQKRVRRLPDVSGRTQQSAPPPNHPANVGLTRLGGSRRLGVRPGGVPVPI